MIEFWGDLMPGMVPLLLILYCILEVCEETRSYSECFYHKILIH